MGGVLIGQESSFFTPAICRHRNAFHMVFVAANETGDLLHAVSSDGVTWTRRNNVMQSTNAAPAIASINDRLRVVFLANNETQELLFATFVDETGVWIGNTRTGLFPRTGPSLQVVGSRLFVYYQGDRFLETADLT